MLTQADQEQFSRILSFWFGHVEETIIPSEHRIQVWFSDSPDIAREIEQMFSSELENIIEGCYDHWAESAHGQLALIIVLDQFSRHLYRDQKEVYTIDEKALDVCLQGMRDSKDHELSLIERVFYYFPLLHSEQLECQLMSLEHYEMLVELALPETRIVYDSFYRFSKQRWSIIDRFGRFPQRNSILQRESTEEETLFLQAIEDKMRGEQ